MEPEGIMTDSRTPASSKKRYNPELAAACTEGAADGLRDEAETLTTLLTEASRIAGQVERRAEQLSYAAEVIRAISPTPASSPESPTVDRLASVRVALEVFGRFVADETRSDAEVGHIARNIFNKPTMESFHQRLSAVAIADELTRALGGRREGEGIRDLEIALMDERAAANPCNSCGHRRAAHDEDGLCDWDCGRCDRCAGYEPLYELTPAPADRNVSEPPYQNEAPASLFKQEDDDAPIRGRAPALRELRGSDESELRSLRPEDLSQVREGSSGAELRRSADTRAVAAMHATPKRECDRCGAEADFYVNSDGSRWWYCLNHAPDESLTRAGWAAADVREALPAMRELIARLSTPAADRRADTQEECVRPDCDGNHVSSAEWRPNGAAHVPMPPLGSPVPPSKREREGWDGEWCMRHDGRNVIGFSVADDVWERVIRGRWNVVCPACFDEEAQAAGVPYSFTAIWPVTWQSAIPRIDARRERGGE